jgi:hypothetical protein
VSFPGLARAAAKRRVKRGRTIQGGNREEEKERLTFLSGM